MKKMLKFLESEKYTKKKGNNSTTVIKISAVFINNHEIKGRTPYRYFNENDKLSFGNYF